MTSTAQLRSIRDLPQFSDLIVNHEAQGFPEEFSELFSLKNVRLLRYEDGVAVFRNKDIREIATNPAAGNTPAEHILTRVFPFDSEVGNNLQGMQRFYRHLVFTSNPPIHGPMRQVIARPLAPRHVSELSTLAKRTVAEVIDEVSGRGAIDFEKQFAMRVTTRFWGALFEMTDEEVRAVAEHVRGQTPAFFFTPTLQETATFDVAMDGYLDQVSKAVVRALDRSGGNELLRSMAAGFDALDSADELEGVGVMIAANVIDGFHTAATGATNTLYELLRCPQELAAVRSEPNLIPKAVAEGLRLWAPLMLTQRYALKDFEFAGVSIPCSTSITMLWAAGNRDPEVFENPNRFELSRQHTNETTFGGGIHVCPGRHTARMLMQAMIEGVMAPEVRIESTGARPAWLKRSTARQLDCMEVMITRE